MSFEFDKPCKEAFDTIKEMLILAPIIQPPNWNLSFEKICDASNYVAGEVLGKKVGQDPHVIYYTLKSLDIAQCNYSIKKKKNFLPWFLL